MGWLKEIQSELDAVLEVFGSLINKLVQEPQDNWRASLACISFNHPIGNHLLSHLVCSHKKRQTLICNVGNW